MDTDGNGKVALSIPLERTMMGKFIHMRDAIMTDMQNAGLRPDGENLFEAEGHRVDMNRDRAVEWFLAHTGKPEWLMMIDSDMEFPVNIVSRLVAWNKPIVGGLYFHRATQSPLVFTNGGKTTNRFGQEINDWHYMSAQVYKQLVAWDVPSWDTGISVHNVPEEEALLKCDALGTGALLIHRSILERMTPPWFQYNTGRHTEDFDFCERVAQQLGDVQIYCDLSTICGHYDLVPMGHAQFRQRYPKRGLQMTAFALHEAARWLSEFCEITEDVARHELETIDTAATWKALWKDINYDDADEVAKFYESDIVGEAYLRELLNWNRTRAFNKLREPLTAYHYKRVLEIGGGIGTVAIQMMVQGCEVFCIEPNHTLRDFIDWRIERIREALPEHIRVNFGKVHLLHDISVMDDMVGRSIVPGFGDPVDLIIAIDTFEHIHHAELQTLLRTLNSMTLRRAHMYTHNNWGQQDVFPMHFDHGSEWETMLDMAGWFMLDNQWAVNVS